MIENSRTLNAGDKIAHYTDTYAQAKPQRRTHIYSILSLLFFSYYIGKKYWVLISEDLPTCSAQPLATASSALSVVLMSLQKNLEILSLIAGILVAPPTISTAQISSRLNSARQNIHIPEQILPLFNININ